MTAHLNSCPVCKVVIDRMQALPGAELDCPNPQCVALLYYSPTGWTALERLGLQAGAPDAPAATASELERRARELTTYSETLLALLLGATDADLANVDTANARALVLFIDGVIGSKPKDAAHIPRLKLAREILLNPSIVTRGERSPTTRYEA